jgi:hypothetical protein
MTLFRLIGCIAVGSLCLFSCKWEFFSNPPNPTSPQEFKFYPGQISGWSESTNPDSFAIWTNQEMEANLDGGAAGWIQDGSVLSIQQDISGPSPEDILALVIMFNDSAQALTAYNDEQSSNPTQDSIPNFQKNVAFMANVGGVYTAYAHFKQFFFQLNVGGFPSEFEALKTTSSFLGLYQSDMKL